MKRSVAAFAAVALTFASAGQSTAGFVVQWGGAGGNGGLNDGDNFSINITNPAPFIANRLTSITGGGYAHNHGSLSVIFGIDLRINSVWTTIHTWTQNGNDHLLSERTLGGPIAFAQGLVDGIRLTESSFVGNAYHGMNTGGLVAGATVFNFDLQSNQDPVPLPSTLVPLSLIGAMFAGWFGVRRMFAPTI